MEITKKSNGVIFAKLTFPAPPNYTGIEFHFRNRPDTGESGFELFEIDQDTPSEFFDQSDYLDAIEKWLQSGLSNYYLQAKVVVEIGVDRELWICKLSYPKFKWTGWQRDPATSEQRVTTFRKQFTY
jgi:hypothetical protein